MRGRPQTATILGLLLAGCFTPTVPVPPPGPDEVTFRLTNQVCDPMDPPTVCDPTATVATYRADPNPRWPNSWVVVRCEETGEGDVTRTQDDGSVAETQAFLCNDGGRVLIGYENDDGEEAGLCLILHDGRSNDNYECP